MYYLGQNLQILKKNTQLAHRLQKGAYSIQFFSLMNYSLAKTHFCFFAFFYSTGIRHSFPSFKMFQRLFHSFSSCVDSSPPFLTHQVLPYTVPHAQINSKFLAPSAQKQNLRAVSLTLTPLFFRTPALHIPAAFLMGLVMR